MENKMNKRLEKLIQDEKDCIEEEAALTDNMVEFKRYSNGLDFLERIIEFHKEDYHGVLEFTENIKLLEEIVNWHRPKVNYMYNVSLITRQMVRNDLEKVRENIREELDKTN